MLSQSLKKLRAAAKLTQAQLAERAGTSPAYVAQVESGHRPEIGFALACRLADALGVSVDRLRGERSARAAR